MNRNDFQLYLLSRMRAASAVDQALKSLGCTRHDAFIARKKAVAYGFEELGHPARLYVQVLGEPDESRMQEDPPKQFAGSMQLRFRLPVWPDFDFVVREDESGTAWNPEVARARAIPVPPIESADDLAAWRLVKPEVTARFGRPKTSDAWSGWEDLIYRMPIRQGGVPERVLVAFDFGLLQSVGRLESHIRAIESNAGFKAG
jgi:hypothetical protein